MQVREIFEITTQNYEADRKLVENIMADVEWGLHERSGLQVSEPSTYFGWKFFTISIEISFIVKMATLYESFKNAKGWTHYEKFENWLNDQLRQAGSKGTVKVVHSERIW
ncbi:MAG: hypothetical protein QXU32_08605 [Nitrososphaerales archaeon]